MRRPPALAGLALALLSYAFPGVARESPRVYVDGVARVIEQDYFDEARAKQIAARLRSAAAKGEPDIFGRIHGGEGRRDFSGVSVTGWQVIGNYAVRFDFSDGHNSGLYSYELLRQLGEAAAP